MADYAFHVEKLKTMYERPWELEIPAFRVFGNLYFVGNADGASWLVDSGEGLILFDSNYPTASAMLIRSIYVLGFRLEDIIAIFHTHGHFDHFGSTAYIKAVSGCKTYLGAGDADMFRECPELALISDNRNSYLEIFTPDVIVHDHDEFVLGNTKIRAVSCPGHSQGATSYFFNVTDGKTELTAGLHGGAGLNTVCASFCREYGVNWRADFLASIDKVINEPVDIFLGNHTKQNQADEKRLRLSDTENPFIDPQGWKEFLLQLRQKFLTMCAEEPL